MVRYRKTQEEREENAYDLGDEILVRSFWHCDTKLASSVRVCVALKRDTRVGVRVCSAGLGNSSERKEQGREKSESSHVCESQCGFLIQAVIFFKECNNRQGYRVENE